MASQGSNTTSLPPSMGPGARPQQPGYTDPGTIIKEVSDIRANYTISVDRTSFSIGYDLNGRLRHYKIPFENVPIGTVSLWALFGGRGRTKVSGTFIIDAVRGAENMSGQTLNQREVEGLALHSSKRIMYAYGGTLTAFSLGYLIAYGGRKNMKFPFMKAKPLERYDNFPNRYLPILKGNYARIMWHITRGNIYAGIGLFFVNPLFRAMGDTSMMVGLYRDDRTKEVVKSMKGSFDRINSNRARANTQQTLPSQQQQTDQDGDPDPQGYYKDPSTGSSKDDGSVPDDSGDSAYVDGPSDGRMLDDAAMKTQEARQSSRSITSSNSSPAKPTPAQPQQQTSGSDFFFDDASPTAGNDQDMATPAPYQSSGSAWDRIRRGVSTSNPNSRPPPVAPANSQRGGPLPSRGGRPSSSSNENETMGDSFSFSSSDEAKQLAKEQAQKEFDDMLDKERKESGSGDYVKAMNATNSESGNDGSTGSVWERRRRGNG